MLSPKMLKSQIHIFAGVGRGRVGSQLLMLSPEMLKSQIHIFAGVGRGRVGCQLLMLSPKMLKSQIPIFAGGEGWQPTFDAESENAKIPNSHFHRLGRGGGDCWPTFDA